MAADFVAFALGTQTAASIIRPASYCGVTGYKPTYGLLPTDGVQAISSTLDHVGVFARSPRDAWYFVSALVLPAAEVAAVRAEGRWFPEILGEGSANARGVVDEYRTAVAPWGFAPEEVRVPVRIFQGSADEIVPPAWGRSLADRVPGASLALFPGEGHFIGLTRREEVLRWLIGRCGPRGTESGRGR